MCPLLRSMSEEIRFEDCCPPQGQHLRWAHRFNPKLSLRTAFTGHLTCSTGTSFCRILANPCRKRSSTRLLPQFLRTRPSRCRFSRLRRKHLFWRPFEDWWHGERNFRLRQSCLKTASWMIFTSTQSALAKSFWKPRRSQDRLRLFLRRNSPMPRWQRLRRSEEHTSELQS